jgi:hypothetical protein
MRHGHLGVLEKLMDRAALLQCCMDAPSYERTDYVNNLRRNKTNQKWNVVCIAINMGGLGIGVSLHHETTWNIANSLSHNWIGRDTARVEEWHCCLSTELWSTHKRKITTL